LPFEGTPVLTRRFSVSTFRVDVCGVFVVADFWVEEVFSPVLTTLRLLPALIDLLVVGPSRAVYSRLRVADAALTAPPAP